MMEVEGPVTSSLVSFIFVVLILREGRDWRECLVIMELAWVSRPRIVYTLLDITFDVHASSLRLFCCRSFASASRTRRNIKEGRPFVKKRCLFNITWLRRGFMALGSAKMVSYYIFLL